MRLLLDTHIYLWSVTNNAHLTKEIKLLINNASEVFVSSASIWEMAIKIKLGKLQANLSELARAIEESHFIELPITAEHAAETVELPAIHKDPFDRIMIAQAKIEPLRFVTSDNLLAAYSDSIIIV